MITASFQNLNPDTDETLDEQDLTAGATFNTVVVNVLFENIDVQVSEENVDNTAVFSLPNNFQVVITEPDPLNVIIERVSSTTVVEDSEVIVLTANEDILVYDPIAINDNGGADIAKSDTLLHFNRYLGLATSEALTGQEVVVKVAGVITNGTWSWDLDKEIYLNDDGTLTQDPDGTEAFSQQIANALTPTTIVLTRNEPVELT